MTIRDDGIGFDTRATVDGLGFREIHARLQHLSGDFTVTSTHRAGTRVEIRLPISRSTQPHQELS